MAGDETRKNINYTRFELALRDAWRMHYWLKLTAKPTVDWEQGAKTGAVAELEGGRSFSGRWRIWLLLGTRLWGEGCRATMTSASASMQRLDSDLRLEKASDLIIQRHLTIGDPILPTNWEKNHKSMLYFAKTGTYS